MNHVESGISGQGLLWQRHFLSERFEESPGLNFLALEPVLDPSSKHAQTPFKIDPEKGVSWQWSNWEQADLKLIYEENKTPVIINLSPPDAPYVQFAKWSEAIRFELSLRRPNGQTSAVKCVLPSNAFAANIEIVEGNNSLNVRLLNNIDGHGIRGEKLVLRGGELHFCEKKVFESKEIIFPIRRIDINQFERFFTVVSRQTVGGWRLLQCGSVNFNGRVSGSNEMPATDLERLRYWVEGDISKQPPPQTVNDWLANWTDFSRANLAELKRLAEMRLSIPANAAEHYIVNHPTGLSRCLALHIIGCQWIAKKASSYIEPLNQNDFLPALQAIEPNMANLSGILSGDLPEQIWALKNLKKPLLAAAVKQAGGEGLNRLRRELHLLEIRAAAVKARDQKEKDMFYNNSTKEKANEWRKG